MSWLEGVEEGFQEEEPPEGCMKLCIPPISKISDELYIGDKNGPASLYLLKKHSITHVLSCFTYEKIVVTDEPSTRIADHFDLAIQFIENAIEKGGRVLVHCQGGVSRSVSMVIAYLMYKYKLRYENALDFVQSGRPIANPNYGFRQQLKDFEKKCI